MLPPSNQVHTVISNSGQVQLSMIHQEMHTHDYSTDAETVHTHNHTNQTVSLAGEYCEEEKTPQSEILPAFGLGSIVDQT